MAMINPITEAQKQFLAGFRCERLKDDPANEINIQYFSNPEGSGLVNKLKNDAWQEDQAGSTAYYVIKDRAGNIVLFFSLKCGVLFDPHQIKDYMELFGGKDYGRIWDAILTKAEAMLPEMQSIRHQDPYNVLLRCDTEEDVKCMQVIIKALGLKRIPALYNQLRDRKDFVDHTNIEKKIETNPNIVRVVENFSAVELVEFCKDKGKSHCWNKKQMGGRSMAETLFWEFVVPKILEVNALIGSEYVFLFAADYGLRPYQVGIGKLIDFYRKLHFDYSNDLGTAKPVYDFRCQFMCQRLRSGNGQPGLDTYRKEFFNNFNEDPNARDYT